MRWLRGCGILLALALILFAVPTRFEGPTLVPISPGHGLALIDVVALAPLLGGMALLLGGLWQRRRRLDAALARRPWLAGGGAFGTGLGLGLLIASVFAFFWWWAVGAGLLTATLLAHGFLGPNGAGKTTTIRVLLGLMRVDAGIARLLDGDPWRDAVSLHRRLAYVPGDVTLWPSLTGGEVIDLLGRLRGGLNTRRRPELLQRFDLDPRKKARTYSKGNRQKVALVAALASDVELLLLDEPTAGLDPLMEEAFRQVIREEQRHGDRTVLLSSHILAEVEALCDRLTIIRDGRAVETGTLADLRHLTRTSIQAELAGPPDGLAALPGVHNLRRENGRVRFDVDADALDPALRQLTAVGVRSLVSQPPTLEELFLRHYGRTGGAGEKDTQVAR